MARVPGLGFFVGVVRGVKAIKEIALAGIGLCTSSVDVHQRMCQRAKERVIDIVYYRFDPDGVDDVGLQEWNQLERLGQLTQSYVERADISHSLNHCVEQIVSTRVYERLEPVNMASQIVDRVDEASIRPHFNIPPANVFFEGRDFVLQKIRDILCDPNASQAHRVALHGLGGVGKTQIAIQYSHRFHRSYNVIIWINTADRLSLEEGFREFATTYHCIDSETLSKLNLTGVVKSVARWLQRQTTWLLILDNLDDPTVIEDCGLPKTGIGRHIVITSRNPNAGGLQAEGVEITCLDPESATKLIISISKVQSFDQDLANICLEAGKIVATLGYLPLAIVQAGCARWNHS
jgi:hypothetical protein